MPPANARRTQIVKSDGSVKIRSVPGQFVTQQMVQQQILNLFTRLLDAHVELKLMVGNQRVVVISTSVMQVEQMMQAVAGALKMPRVTAEQAAVEVAV